MNINFNRTHLIPLLLIISIAAIGYLDYRYYWLRSNFLQTIENFEKTVNSLSQDLATTTAERNYFEQKYIDEKNKMDSFSSQIEDIQGDVAILEKLSQTDPELLKKYSKVYFLNENYVPKSFAKIDSEYTYDTQKDYLFNYEAWPFLRKLLRAAEDDEIDIKIISAYRSFGTQAETKSSYKMIYGFGANTFSADQGYSEHQLGTAVDFTTAAIGSAFTTFEKTPAYQWLLENAYRYGFILSYPENNQYYVFEPWHWRFVGRDLAKKLHKEGKNFYDLDQREIDQHLISLFD